MNINKDDMYSLYGDYVSLAEKVSLDGMSTGEFGMLMISFSLKMLVECGLSDEHIPEFLEKAAACGKALAFTVPPETKGDK
jgi:hypothetical protein